MTPEPALTLISKGKESMNTSDYEVLIQGEHVPDDGLQIELGTCGKIKHGGRSRCHLVPIVVETLFGMRPDTHRGRGSVWVSQLSTAHILPMEGADRSSTWSPNMVRSFCADPSFLDMEFRFRRRLRIFPGLSINLSKKADRSVSAAAVRRLT